MHCEPDKNLKVGDKVNIGDKIGTESDKGADGAVHTHVEVRDKRKTRGAKSLGDPTLDNDDPTPYWNKKGYSIK